MILRQPVDAIAPRSMRTVVATNPKSPVAEPSSRSPRNRVLSTEQSPPGMSNNRGASDTPKCDVAACTRARPRSLQRVARLWRPPSRIGRKLPGRPRFSSQANVGLSCEPREQAERRASDALRSVGVRQIQALVGGQAPSFGSLPVTPRLASQLSLVQTVGLAARAAVPRACGARPQHKQTLGWWREREYCDDLLNL